MAGTTEIDMIKYGEYCEKVVSMEKRVEKIEEKMDQLLELANRGKGGLWFGMTVIAVISSLVGIVISYLGLKGH